MNSRYKSKSRKSPKFDWKYYTIKAIYDRGSKLYKMDYSKRYDFMKNSKKVNIITMNIYPNDDKLAIDASVDAPSRKNIKDWLNRGGKNRIVTENVH